jgi:predicted nucleic acid-binding protein
MEGLTFDTGALIALERKRQRMAQIFARAVERRMRMTVPAIVFAEWWRGAGPLASRIRESMIIEPVDESLAAIAGEAMAVVKGATINDAIVMASAATRGDGVYTSDYDDLTALGRRFPSVRVLAV